MIKLKDMVNVKANNEYCVILEIEDGHDADLFCLGCFSGNEKTIRVARDNGDTITIIYDDGKQFSWSHGELVSDRIGAMRRQIKECLFELGFMRAISHRDRYDKIFYTYCWKE